MSPPHPLLKLANVTKRFDSPQGTQPLIVLEAVSLELGTGESLAIVGPSGSGKSTLLHLIGTLDRPTSGEITLAGRDLSRLKDEELAGIRNRQIGFVFQFHYLLPQCTVLENVLVPTLVGNRQTGGSVTERATRLLTRVGLAERLNHRPGQLSGGERQRVAVVRALINQPELLLADEPTGALDQASAKQLAQILIELNREEGVALIVVTHARDLANRMARLLELKSGNLVESARTPDPTFK
jgi:ABC-type lipoprotein export system ATPase subunit